MHTPSTIFDGCCSSSCRLKHKAEGVSAWKWFSFLFVLHYTLLFTQTRRESAKLFSLIFTVPSSPVWFFRCWKGRALHHHYRGEGFQPPQRAARRRRAKENVFALVEHARVNLLKQISRQSQMFVLVVRRRSEKEESDWIKKQINRASDFSRFRDFSSSLARVAHGERDYY